MGVSVRFPVILELSLKNEVLSHRAVPDALFFHCKDRLRKIIHEMLVVSMCWKDSSCWVPQYPGNVWVNPSLPVEGVRRI